MRRFLSFLAFVIIMLALAYGYLRIQEPALLDRVLLRIQLYTSVPITDTQTEPPTHFTVDSLHYHQTKKKAQSLRLSLQETENDSILKGHFTRLLADSLIPYWYGTDWDFNGISEQPGQGAIACGYFVNTLLRDVGMNIPRIKMSQQASETIIKSYVNEKHINRYSDFSLSDFIEDIIERPPGIYIVGLDSHVGLLHHQGDDIRFIHSAYGYPGGVVNEDAKSSIILDWSVYRVVGCLTCDSDFLSHWKNGAYISVYSG